MSLLSKTHSQTVSSCSTVMALLYIPVSELVCCTFSTILICPFLIQRIYLSPRSLFLLASSNFLATCIYILFADHSSTSFTYKCTCSKYTSKEGLKLFRLLTMELCFVKKCITGFRSAQCNIHDLSHYMRPCNSCVVSLMWDYSLMYGWPWKHQYQHTSSLVKG